MDLLLWFVVILVGCNAGLITGATLIVCIWNSKSNRSVRFAAGLFFAGLDVVGVGCRVSAGISFVLVCICGGR